MRNDYRSWLEAQRYSPGTVSAQLHRAGRVEDHYGDLDRHYKDDRLQGLVDTLRYSTEDERRQRPNPTNIPIDGNLRNNLASYRFAIENYRRFRESDGMGEPEFADGSVETRNEEIIAAVEEEIVQRIGLERDMQAALRVAIEQLEVGLAVIDDGAERYVDSGRIDITAQDRQGAIVVIELKAGPAGQRAVAQVLSYMGDVAMEEPDTAVRGILVASAFDKKAIAAARMVPALDLRTYGVKFHFADPLAKAES